MSQFQAPKEKKNINNSSFNKAIFSLNKTLFQNETNLYSLCKISHRTNKATPPPTFYEL